MYYSEYQQLVGVEGDIYIYTYIYMYIYSCFSLYIYIYLPCALAILGRRRRMRRRSSRRSTSNWPTCARWSGWASLSPTGQSRRRSSNGTFCTRTEKSSSSRRNGSGWKDSWPSGRRQSVCSTRMRWRRCSSRHARALIPAGARRASHRPPDPRRRRRTRWERRRT